MQPVKTAIVPDIKDNLLRKKLIITGSLSGIYKKKISENFNFLKNFFDFDPMTVSPYKIEVIIIPTLEEFKRTYKQETEEELAFYIVGFAAKNGRIFILDKTEFQKQQHKEDEFERVVLHELAHIFVRRIIDPKQTLHWIEEGVCEFLSFGDNLPAVKNPVDFNELNNRKWNENPVYVQAASFFKYISRKYGDSKIVDLLKRIKKGSEEKAFKEVFGGLNKIQKEFFDSLKNERIASSRNTLQ